VFGAVTNSSLLFLYGALESVCALEIIVIIILIIIIKEN